MSIIVEPSIKTGSISINNIMNFYRPGKDGNFYQEMKVPFLICITSSRGEDPLSSSYSVFTPEAVFNGSIRKSITGIHQSEMHQHNYFEFAYVISGNMYMIIEGQKYLFSSGSCCLINRNTFHIESYTSDFVCIFFSVSTRFFARLKNYGNDMMFPIENAKYDNLIFKFMTENGDENHSESKDFIDFVPKITETEQKVLVHDIFENMLKTILDPYYGATYRLQDLFLQLLDILCNENYYQVQHLNSSSSMESMLFARVDQILDSCNGRITNRQLSELLNYDGSYIGRIVKKNTGMSLFNYSMTFTMKEAARLLTTTNMSISEIALELNFNNRTHFYKQFGAIYGMTPAEYRKQL